MAVRQKLAQAAPCALSLKVVLHCTKTEEVEEKVITFESFPATILDIKKQIEKQHSVPVCVQEISYNGHKVNDGVELSTMKVHNGDTFNIKYLAKGHCSEITEIMASLKVLLAAIEDKTSSKDVEPTATLLRIVSRLDLASVEQMLEDLSFKYFSPWLDSNTYVNKLHFAYYNGIEVLMKIYEELLQVPWQERANIEFKYLEYAILMVLWNFTEITPFKQLVIGHNGIQMCTQSMLRVRLEEGKKIQEIVPRYTPRERSILLETVLAGAAILCNLTDLPSSVMSEISKCHMEIASNEDTLHQMTCLSSMHRDDARYELPVSTTFICLAFTSKTHKYLAKLIFIRRLLCASQARRRLEEVQLLLKYFTMVFLAQVALASPHCVPQDYQEEIISEMRSFLQSTCYQTVMELEIKRGYMWCTFLPFIKLIYIPESTNDQLYLTSLQMIVFNLQNMLSRVDHRQIFLTEGLLDFVMCIPQYVPVSLRPQAKELVRMVASAPDIPVEGPPKLLNLVKARLAKMYFGLEQVLSLSVSDIVSKVHPT